MDESGSEASEHFVTLATLAKGAVAEAFDEELRKVLRNIGDINTAPTAAREISIKVRIKPDEERRMATVSAAATSKVAPVRPVATAIFIARRRNDEVVAVEYDPEQGLLFEQGADIRSIKRGA